MRSSPFCFCQFSLPFFLFLIFLKRNQKDNISAKLDEMYSKIRNDINFAVTPNSINLSPSTDDFMQFAVEVWRIEQRMAKLQINLPENQKKGLENSVQKLKRYFEKYDIKVIDYTNQKFNDGLNLDVLSVEKDPAIMEPIIKETVEPTIMYRGQVVRKAKIIVLTK